MRTRAALPRLLSLAASAALASACAASREPNPARPRSDAPPYPVVLAANAERREAALSAWARLANAGAAPNTPAPELQPVTATVSALPPGATGLRLPLVEIEDVGKEPGGETEDEATRESLRRFIAGAGALLGAEPRDLSLVEVRGEAGGTRSARYQQQPFPYALRGGFGAIDITFTADRRVTALTSTAIPDAERFTRSLAAQRPQQLPADQAVARLKGRAFTYATADGGRQTYTAAADDEIRPRELVVYPLRRANDPAVLELHVAWEMSVGRGGSAPHLVYLDAVTGEVIAAAAAQAAPTPAPGR